MQNKILCSILGLVLAVIFLGVGVWIGKSYIAEDVNTENEEVLESSINSDQQMSTLESGFYNFKITYPSRLVLGASSLSDSIGHREIVLVDEETVMWETDKSHDGITIDVLFNPKELSFKEFVDDKVNNSVAGFEGEKMYWNKEEITVGGRAAFKLTPTRPEWKRNTGSEEIYIESPTFGSTHIIKITEQNAGDNTFDQVFHQIVDSFEFTD